MKNINSRSTDSDALREYWRMLRKWGYREQGMQNHQGAEDNGRGRRARGEYDRSSRCRKDGKWGRNRVLETGDGKAQSRIYPNFGGK